MTDQEKEAIAASLEAAAEKGLYRRTDMRSPIKLSADAAKISICIPMGDKDDPDLLVCPHCAHRHFGTVTCDQCGKPHNAGKRLRHAGLAPVEWLLNAWQIVPPLLCSMQVMVRKSILSAQARNEMTFDAIRLGSKYIFYWDDDTIIPPKAIYELHNMMERTPDAGIISGVYTTREQCPEPLIYKKHGEGSYWNFSTKPGVLEEIFGAGAGCMMARVSALEEVEKLLGGPWWADEYDFDRLDAGEGRTTWGHDIRFCKRMTETGSMFREARAADGSMTPDPSGPSQPWKTYVAGWIQCYHFGVEDQTMYGLPANASCNVNANTASYWDHVWGAEGQATRRIYTDLYDRIVELVPRHANVVDIGCGIGVLMDMLAKKKQTQSYGYDVSPKAIGMLQSRWLDGEAMDVKDFKLNHFPAKSSVVVSTETLEHLDDERLDRVLVEASKARMAIFTSPDGVLQGTPEGEHVQVFTAKTFKNRLLKHFSSVRVEKVAPQHLLAVCQAKKSPAGSEDKDEHVAGPDLVQVEHRIALGGDGGGKHGGGRKHSRKRDESAGGGRPVRRARKAEGND